MHPIRSLTREGRFAAAEMLAQVRSGELVRPDMKALDIEPLSVALDATFAEPVASELQSRWHLAQWLVRSFGQRDTRIDAGGWSWLALRLFDVLCPEREGKRRVREDARYLLEAGDYRKAHRHLLAGPFLLMQAHIGHPEAVRGLLATSPDAPGEVYEQLAARKYTVASRAVVEVATRLYFDPATGGLKRGSGGAGAGSPRRLVEVLQQFDLTYDLQQITDARLESLLPREFSRFSRRG